MWSILAKQRHRDIWTNPSDPFRHSWIGNILCSYICTLQGMYLHTFIIYFKCRQPFSPSHPLHPFLSEFLNSFLPITVSPATLHSFFSSLPFLLLCLIYFLTPFLPLPSVHFSLLFPPSSTEQWDYFYWQSVFFLWHGVLLVQSFYCEKLFDWVKC